jgi:glutathione reductase (NADPH)
VRSFVASEMKKCGVALRVNTDVKSVTKTSEGLNVLLLDGSVITVDSILYATGRVPHVTGMGIETLGISQNQHGAIKVNDDYQTNIASIYALGDVTARIQLTPVALGEAMKLVDHLFGDNQRAMNYEFIPTAVFTHPNIGTVGYGEAEARAKFGDITVFKTDFKPLKHTLSGSSERVFMKLIVDSASDRVVGLHMVGSDAGEIVQGFAVAMKAGATKAIFDSTIGIHPTAAEEFVTMRTPVATQ